MLPGIGSNIPHWLNRPLTHITPLSLSDGATYERKLDWVYTYLTRDLIGSLEGVLDLWFTNYKKDWVNHVAEVQGVLGKWDNLFDAFMLDVVAQLEKLNDQASANLVRSLGSELRKALDENFASKEVQRTVDTGRLSETELQKRYAAKETQNIVDNGRLSEKYMSMNFSGFDNGERVYTANFIKGSGAPDHGIIRLKNGMNKPGTLKRIVGGDSNAVNPPRETLKSFYAKTGASVMINASGWWVGDNNRFMGLSIKNGKLIQGWDPQPSDLGQAAAVIMSDGSLRMYDNTTAPSKIIQDGGLHSFGWGAAAYKDGVVTDFMKYSRYNMLSARQLIGDTMDGDLIIISIPGVTGNSGARGADIINIASGHNIKNLYVLDGGGSMQTLIGGHYWLPSGDGKEREVPDAFYFYAAKSAIENPAWQVLEHRGDGFSGGAVEWCVVNGQCIVRVANVSAANPGALINVAQLPSTCPRPTFNITGHAYINTRPDDAQNARVSTTGGVDITVPVAGAVFAMFRYDV